LLAAPIARWLVAALLLSTCSSAQPVVVATPIAHTPGPLGDTWFDHGTKWRQAPGAHPSPRYAASLAYDAARSNFVLFGGQFGSVSYDDTWTFDGQTWKHHSPAHNPPARRDAAMAFDPSLHEVVMYG